MTKREAAIVSAYTGIIIGGFSEFHRYIEGILERPTFTHELGNKEVTKSIKELSKTDFLNIKVQ